MKILLLGATGLLGHNVLHRLLDEGYDVVAVVRRREGLYIPLADANIVEGSILDATTLTRAAGGCDAIINCAGTTDMSLLYEKDYMPVNRDLPATLIDIMKHHGIKRLVHISSVDTIGYGDADHPADEHAAMRWPFTESYYALSKRAGEEAILKGLQDAPGLEAVILNPGYMLGAYDVRPSSGEMLRIAYRKSVMCCPRGGKAFVPVADVADAAVRALTRGTSGSRYIVTHRGGHLTIKQLYALQADIMGYRQLCVVVPAWIMLAIGALGDLLRSMGMRSAVSRRNIRQLLVREYYDNHHGLCDLGYVETSLADAIHDFHTWRQRDLHKQR